MRPPQGAARWLPVYVALGSNLDHPATQLRRALSALGALPDTRLVTCSPLYASPPMGPQDQPDFVNAVAALLTRLGPGTLLAGLKAIEREQGRAADAPRWGPRIIDLDIIAMGGLVVDEPGLNIPHPGAAERNFVLRPLADIAPELELPGLGRVVELLAALTAPPLRIVTGGAP